MDDIGQRLADEDERQREIIKGSWRFWVALNGSAVERMEDRGYLLLRVRKDAYQAFDALFREG